MQAGDRQAFETILGEMFAALDKPLGDVKVEAFWKGLQRLSILDMARIRDELLAELESSEPPKNFTVADVWALKRKLRARAPVVVNQRSLPAGTAYDEGALEAEIGRLTSGDKPERAAQFASYVRQNVRNWEERRAADPIGTQWLLLDAAVARADANEDDSLFREERMKWLKQRCAQLVKESGDAYCGRDLTRVRVIRRLLGGLDADRVIGAADNERRKLTA